MAGIDATPFLVHAPPNPTESVRAQGLRQAARMIRRASTGRRTMREPSMAVRETAAQEIEERQVDWAYSRPVVALDVAWNSAFVAAAIAAVIFTRRDSLHLPLRLWVSGYALQCVVHVVCVCVVYCRRRRRATVVVVEDGGGVGEGSVAGLRERYDDQLSAMIRHLESANTMFSFVWWVIGFYWICVGGRALQQDSLTLYWLCVFFLVLDLFFVVFCVALASVIAAAVCCCLPCIIAILYVLADRGGASKEDIELLPKYTFHRIGSGEKINQETECPRGGIMTECGTNNPIEHRLTAEDAECCICLSTYEDGSELRELPCGHHFHCACIDKWLYINSTCPLCKYDISNRYTRDTQV